MTKRQKQWLASAGVLVLLGVVAFYGARRSETVQYLTSKVQRGEVRDAVEATGKVDAVIAVQVGSQVSGTIAKLNVDFNSRVRRGDVIALIEPSLLQGTLLQATADLENAKANVVVATANVAKANAAFVQAKAELERFTALAQSGAGTPQELDVAKANYGSAKATLDAGEAAVVQAKAQVSQKEAAVSVARINLDHSVIRSPIDGIVVARNVDVGQTVAASLQAPTIFTIAQDLTKMQVYAKVDESDVGRIRLGQRVSFKVDAFPKDQFTGVVSQIRMNPTTIQNVVTYDAVVAFANPDLKLFPGMTAYVSLPVATAEDVVKLPNAALRFRPPFAPEVVRALYAKYGIDTASNRRTVAGDDGDSARRTTAPAAQSGQPTAGAPSRRPERPESAIVWKIGPDNSLIPVRLTLGITDHAFTEVVAVATGALAAGDDVITSAVTSKVPVPGAPGGTIRR